MIGKSGVRGSGISVLPARHDDDDGEIALTIIFPAFYFYLQKLLLLYVC